MLVRHGAQRRRRHLNGQFLVELKRFICCAAAFLRKLLYTYIIHIWFYMQIKWVPAVLYRVFLLRIFFRPFLHSALGYFWLMKELIPSLYIENKLYTILIVCYES